LVSRPTGPTALTRGGSRKGYAPSPLHEDACCTPPRATLARAAPDRRRRERLRVDPAGANRAAEFDGTDLRDEDVVAHLRAVESAALDGIILSGSSTA